MILGLHEVWITPGEQNGAILSLYVFAVRLKHCFFPHQNGVRRGWLSVHSLRDVNLLCLWVNAARFNAVTVHLSFVSVQHWRSTCRLQPATSCRSSTVSSWSCGDRSTSRAKERWPPIGCWEKAIANDETPAETKRSKADKGHNASAADGSVQTSQHAVKVLQHVLHMKDKNYRHYRRGEGGRGGRRCCRSRTRDTFSSNSFLILSLKGSI